MTPAGFTMDFENVEPLIAAFRRMVRATEFDICELAVTTYICAKSYGKKFTAIPIFPARMFHHGAIVVNKNAGINSPKDLEGKRVGVNRGFTVTTGVWIRGILAQEYGVDLSKVTWVLSGDEHVEEYRAPANVVPLEAGKKMDEMVISGELVGAVNMPIDHADVHKLIPNAEEAAFEALTKRKLYPINHTVAVRDELLEAHPDLAKNIFNAFAEAKRVYVEKLKTGTIENPTKLDKQNKKVMDITGDPLPYGVEPNKIVLEALMDTAAKQGIIKAPLSFEQIF
ncbi:MAG: ABC transporter substrate-binding protein, partial [Alphaproteobacteria bacterium]